VEAATGVNARPTGGGPSSERQTIRAELGESCLNCCADTVKLAARHPDISCLLDEMHHNFVTADR
jgi:hypothetical protein